MFPATEHGIAPGIAAEQLVREYDDVRDPGGDPELEAVKAAIFLEDAFGITVTDDDIDPRRLGTAAGMLDVVRRRQGPR